MRLTAAAVLAAALTLAACNREAPPEDAANAVVDASNAAEEAETAAAAARDAANAAAANAEEAGVVVPGASAPTTDANPTPSQMVPADDTKG